MSYQFYNSLIYIFIGFHLPVIDFKKYSVSFIFKCYMTRIIIVDIILFILNPTIYITHHIDSLSTFTIPSLYEVNDLLMKSHCTSPTDPLPLSLYHTLSPLFSLIFLDIIANSLNSGQVSPCLKTAIISPILKKQHLDPNSFSNYHPISHLPLLSKILERIVSKQLIAHVSKK